MFILILSLNILQRLLAEFGVIRKLSKILRPVLKIFGLPAKTSFLWIVANILGLAYGAAVMIEETELGKISPEDADLLNHHIAISHSNLEDVCAFLSIGASLGWMLDFPMAVSGHCCMASTIGNQNIQRKKSEPLAAKIKYINACCFGVILFFISLQKFRENQIRSPIS